MEDEVPKPDKDTTFRSQTPTRKRPGCNERLADLVRDDRWPYTDDLDEWLTDLALFLAYVEGPRIGLKDIYPGLGRRIDELRAAIYAELSHLASVEELPPEDHHNEHAETIVQ